MTAPQKVRISARLSPFRRAEHAFVILAFLVLAATGLSQKFFGAAWASFILRMLGGVDGTRLVHHLAGVLAFCHLSLHLIVFLRGVATRSLRLSLFPVPQDFRDFVNTWRYRLGLETKPPIPGAFTYRQKFEYLGLLLAKGVMVSSGMILLFPRLAIVILPGHIIPAAREAHSNDALIAYLLLVAWHFYSVILSPNCEFQCGRETLISAPGLQA